MYKIELTIQTIELNRFTLTGVLQLPEYLPIPFGPGIFFKNH